ncbi:hypothetical protein BH23THE1_BH23THE1_12300 [soil metagenome]
MISSGFGGIKFRMVCGFGGKTHRSVSNLFIKIPAVKNPTITELGLLICLNVYEEIFFLPEGSSNVLK